MMQHPTIFALDFGTTNSLLAGAATGRIFDPVPLDPHANDPTVLRSALHFTTADDVLFGEAAVRRYIASGLRGRLLRSLKRHLSWRGVEGTRIGGRRVTIEDIAAMFLRYMREQACRAYSAEVDRVLLGRPARFSERADEDALAQERLGRAAKIAGFRDVWFCYEPVAAAYDYTASFERPRLVLIADLGGGTSDFTVARMRPSEFSPDDVLAVGGVSLAGDALDGALVRSVVAPLLGSGAPYRIATGSNVLTMPGQLLELLCSPANLTLTDGPWPLRMLDEMETGLLNGDDSAKIERFRTLLEDNVGYQFYESVEGTKVRLSREDRTALAFDYPGVELDEPVTRPSFEASIGLPLERILQALDATVRDAGLRAEEIEIACLTGGTSLVPVFERALRDRLKNADVVRLRSHHSVVQGLARCAQALEEGSRDVSVVPFSESGAQAPAGESAVHPRTTFPLWFPAPRE